MPSKKIDDKSKSEASKASKSNKNSTKEAGADSPGTISPGTQQQQPSYLPGLKNASIYTRVCELLPLSDDHRKQFKVKRGFTDETITAMRFRSLGPHAAVLKEVLLKEFSKEELIESGVFVKIKNTGEAVLEEQLLKENILIPYIGSQNEIYHIRPHKLGFAGVPIQPYSTLFLSDRPEHIILTEGEFKAAALHQWGIPSIAIPGISSFGAKHLDRLTDTLKSFKVSHITVIFDNEIKDNPTLPNYKAKASERYNTQLWAYLMAFKLKGAGFKTDISNLPDAWRKNGKIDFDGALADGKTKNEILSVIQRAGSPGEFLEGLTEESRKVVKRQISTHFAKLKIKREWNKYVAKRTQANGTPYDEPITNFVINIKASFVTPEGIVRFVQFVNEFGETSSTFSLDPGEMAGPVEFKKFCFSKGNYVYDGKLGDLNDIWKLEFNRDTGEFIYMPDKIGRIEKNLWLFGNVAIKDGKTYFPDNDGIFWIEGKGYKPQSLQLSPAGHSTENAIPSLSTAQVDIKDVAEKLRRTVGGYEAYMAVGWIIAGIFSEDIFAKYRCVPILYPHGKRSSGKTAFMHIVMSLQGIDTEGIGLAETSQNFITRALAYYSSLGVWFDEYRNETKITSKDGFLRSAYNRQFSGKGTTSAFQAKGFAVNAAIVISGEELPKDNGLFSRLVPIQVSEYKRDRTWFEWLNRNCEKFSGFTYHLIINYKKYLPLILEAVEGLKNSLVDRGISDRTAINWAICAACFDVVVKEDDEFMSWVEKTCQEIKQTGEQEHILNQFWNDISYLLTERDLNEKYIKLDNGILYLWLSGIYEKWSIHYRKKTGQAPFDEMSIQKYLKDEPYFIKSKSKLFSFSDGRKRGWAINMRLAPEIVREIAEIVSNGLYKNEHESDLPDNL